MVESRCNKQTVTKKKTYPMLIEGNCGIVMVTGAACRGNCTDN